ncbi:MAG: adenosylcobinamide-GDP ribazoletransferase [Desulfobacterales bacterium]|nr:adenosylcobinamide-GDP ribazoletransferase [Desulfobacterales bacterium]
MLQKLLGAVQFLTILPVPSGSAHASADEIGKSSAFFPIVGLIQGFLLALVYAIFVRIFPNDIVAALVVASLVLSNGGFHIDGLSDTVDALASRKSKERMIAIMKDSTTGPIGVVSIVILILIKYLLFQNVFFMPGVTAYVVLILTPVLARWSMVPALFHAKSARDDGLGKIFIEQTGHRELIVATSLATGIAAVNVLMASHLLVPLKIIVIFISCYIFSFSMSRFFAKKFGGLTGDNLGAITEMNEVLCLFMFLVPYPT